jgi:hypothetical protein
LSALYRFELECYQYHRWVTSPTENEEHGIDKCLICGSEIRGYQRWTLTDKFNFIMESAERLNFKGKVESEKRYYIAIQDHRGFFLARHCNTFTWDEAVANLAKLKDVNQNNLLDLLKKKNWSVYSVSSQSKGRVI